MNTEPEIVTFEESFSEAENNALAVLAEAARMEIGRNAFLGLSYFCDSFCFTLTESSPNDSGFWASHPQSAIPFMGKAVCQFANRADAFRWMGRIVQSLPLTAPVGNLQQMRVEEIGAINHDFVAFPNETKEKLVYTVEITLRLVFMTGGKDS